MTAIGAKAGSDMADLLSTYLGHDQAPDAGEDGVRAVHDLDVDVETVPVRSPGIGDRADGVEGLGRKRDAVEPDRPDRDRHIAAAELVVRPDERRAPGVVHHD